MALFDLPLEELEKYRPERPEPADFDAFWQRTLTEARECPLNASFENVDFGLTSAETYDVTFSGFGGQPVKGWLLVPRGIQKPLPVVVEYIGYGGGRGFPTEWLFWSSAGFIHLVMDTRGQGSEWRRGDTPDLQPRGAYPHIPGFLTQGILDPEQFYYRRLYTDAVRAVEAACNFSLVDSERVAVTGGSQGGGLAIAAAGLEPAVKVCMADVPFLAHMRRAVDLTDQPPYTEVARFLHTHRDQVENVFKTLSYFDGMNFAARTTASTLFSVGLMDMVCPPSTVFAAYNYLKGEKEIRVYPYNQHEGGGPYQELEKLRFLRRHWPAGID